MSMLNVQESLLKRWQEHKAYNLPAVKELVQQWQKLPATEGPLKAKIQECIEALLLHEQNKESVAPKPKPNYAAENNDVDWEKKLKQALSAAKVETIKSNALRSQSPSVPAAPVLPDLSKIPQAKEKLAHLKLLNPELPPIRQNDDSLQKNQMIVFAISIAALFFSILALFR
jgi:hypothetical protein